MVELDLHAFHMIVLDSPQMNFLFVVWPEVSQGWRIERHLVLSEQTSDERVVLLAAQS